MLSWPRAWMNARQPQGRYSAHALTLSRVFEEFVTTNGFGWFSKVKFLSIDNKDLLLPDLLKATG